MFHGVAVAKSDHAALLGTGAVSDDPFVGQDRVFDGGSPGVKTMTSRPLSSVCLAQLGRSGVRIVFT